MKKTQWLKLLSTLLLSHLFLISPCQAAVVDKLVIFGDSLSDNGNLYAISSAAHKVIPLVPVVPMDPPYFKGRFSNGPVWNEILAQSMNIELANYAYGGAWVESVWDSRQVVPFDLGTQVNFYLVSAAQDFNKEKHLYVIWAGANDYVDGRSDAEYATTNTVAVIKKQIDWLIYYGAKQFLIFTIPDLSLIPEVAERGAEYAAAIGKLTTLHNEKVAAMIAAEKAEHPDLKFILSDISSYFSDVIEHPAKFNLEDTKTACYRGGYDMMLKLANIKEIEAAKEVKIDLINNASLRTAYYTSRLSALGEQPCKNPDKYLFWDHIHPTRIGHEIISVMAMGVLSENDITGPVKNN